LGGLSVIFSCTTLRHGFPCLQNTQIYFDTIRECYEAFVIYSFFMYLLAYLEEEYGDISVYLSTKEEISHMWGIQYLFSPWRMGDDFLWQCKKVRC
jgi:hypothetical protein